MPYDWSARVHYVDCHRPGLTRKGRGRGFVYLTPTGERVTDAATRARIAAIAIPPAWRHVWIAVTEHAHVQATGRDQRYRKQYRYHPAWASARRQANYERLGEFAAALPRIRKFVDGGLRRRDTDRTFALALVLRLLDHGMIRIGNEEYEKTNGSRGLTTLRKSNVRIDGGDLKFHFIGKSGIEQRVSIHDARAARALRRCHELPGQHLFNYRDDDGTVHAVTSGDVNELLERISGGKFTAKDFRTWAGTLTTFDELRAREPGESATATAAIIKDAARLTAMRLGNTVAVCRQHYIHPQVVDAFTAGELQQWAGSRKARRGLSGAETALAAFLHDR